MRWAVKFEQKHNETLLANLFYITLHKKTYQILTIKAVIINAANQSNTQRTHNPKTLNQLHNDQNKRRTILSDKRIIFSRQIDEPIPIRIQSKQNRRTPKQRRYRGRTFRVSKISFTNNMNIPGSSKNRHRVNPNSQTITISLRCKPVNVKQVKILRMVNRKKQTEDSRSIANRSSNEVSNGRNKRKRGWIRVVKNMGSIGKETGIRRRWSGCCCIVRRRERKEEKEREENGSC